MTPHHALAHASYLSQMGPPDTWKHEVPGVRRSWLKNARGTIVELRKLGFELVSRKKRK